jgi:transposase
MKKNHTSSPAPQGRVIGLDLHPDVFSAAALAGRDAATAQVEQSWDRLRTAELEKWARKLQPGDVVVLEASGNSFTAVERLRAAGVPAIVLESQRAGQIRKSYCANDRLDAVKLARIYLSGLAQPVWTPDETTRARRETLATYRKAVVTAVRVRNRLKSFLSDHHVRLGNGAQLTRDSGAKAVLAAAPWSSLQRMVLEEMLAELRMAHDRRQRLSAAIAREVAAYPRILQLMRLLGVRHIIAFAIMAVVGDIERFANPRKLVAYLGLTPSVEDSGLTIRGRGALVSAGRGDLRSLLTQAAQNAMNQKASPLHAWGWKLCLRKGHRNIAVTAVARKLTVSIWYLLKGLFRPLASVDDSLKVKLTKLATAIGLPAIRELGYKSKAAFIEEKEAWLLKPA